MKPTPSFILSLLFFLVLVTGCSAPNQQAPDFRLLVAVERLSVKQGETGTLRITIQKTGLFTTPVALSLTGNPAGVMGTFDSTSTSDESTLSLSVAVSAAAGESTLTITGKAGDIVKTATLQLTVIENITLEIAIAGLPAGVAANVVVTGPNAFQQTLSTSTTLSLSELTPGTYSFVVNDVKPDSATFSKISGPSDLEFTAQQDESVTLTYGCSLVTPPDANLDTFLKTATNKAAYTCADLAALTELNASRLGIQNLEGLQYAVGLTDLKLTGNGLTNLPENIFNDLTALTSLGFNDNDLNSLPENVFNNLKALTSLDLSFNNLTSLPENIFADLTALTLLNLNGNDLTGLPETIFDNLTALEGLTIFDNGLTSLPQNIFANLTALRNLNLSGNQLNSLPPNMFDNLTALTTLNLSQNCLQATKVPTKGQLVALAAQVTSLDTFGNPKTGCVAVSQPAISSTFDTSTEGWTVLGDGTNLSHVATGGNPGGFIEATDGAQGSTWYWKAPALYYGDARDYIGKTLKFSLKQSATDSGFDDVDVILRNSNFASILVAEITAPGVGFTDYEITLTGDNFNFTDNAFAQMLENLTSIEIRGKYRTGADTGGLDSVSFGE
jgi:Leucine rich repeat/Laminin B (Domain IV)